MEWASLKAVNMGETNWAVVCGRVSDVAVVDVDPRNGGDIDAVIAELKVSTMAVRTGGGGWHLYFRLDGRKLSSCPSWRQGVDLQAEGKYVVAPGSIHPSGVEYLPVTPYVLASAPDILWSARRTPDTPGRGAVEEHEPWVAQALAHPELVEAGNQNETLNKLAWYFARRVDEDIATALLVNWGMQLQDHDEAWPWIEEDITEHVARVFEDWRKKQPQTTVRINVGERAEAPQVNPLLAKGRGPAAFMAERAEEVDWVAEDFVAPGCITEILGAVKAGKSTWICGMLNAVANGEPWLERKTRRAKVLYVTEQEGMSLQATLKRGRLEGLTEEDIVILTMRDLFEIQGWKEQVHWIVDMATSLGCTVIVIDTLARLAGLVGDEENSAGKAAETTAPFNEAKAKGLAVVFLRHGRKSGGNASDMGRGSSAFSGDVDIIVALTQKDKAHKEMEVKGRLSEPFSAYLQYKDGTYVSVRDPRAVKAEAKDLEGLALLVDVLSTGGLFSIRGLVEGASRAGHTISRDQVKRVLESNPKTFFCKDKKWGVRPVIVAGGDDGEA
jgi:hypothetical protein